MNELQETILGLASLHDEDVDQAHDSVFIILVLVVTLPQLHIQSGGRRQGGAEPRRVVEVAASISGATAGTVPQGVSIDCTGSRRPVISSVAEVVVPYEIWENIVVVGVGIDARTAICGSCLSESSNERPDVLT